MKKHVHPVQVPGQQLGAVLVISLIFLVVLTLLGLTASRTAIMEERMAGNMRDRSLAMQAAELALRRAEQHVALGMDVNSFSSDCTNGLCTWQDGSPVWNSEDDWGNAISYGTTSLPTGDGNEDLDAGPDLPAGITAPDYLIEGKIDQSLGTGGAGRLLYRITVRATGLNTNTAVWLQEIVWRQ